MCVDALKVKNDGWEQHDGAQSCKSFYSNPMGILGSEDVGVHESTAATSRQSRDKRALL